MTNVQSVPYWKLIAADEINARPKTREALDELATSIATRGLIQPLAVRATDAGKYQIIDGRRRHAAIAKLVKSGQLDKNCPVPVLVREDDDADALEVSLIANTNRLPMHPVDQHQVFARLADQGFDDAEIASHFAISEKTVRQHKALGQLAPEIRDAYKKGQIDVKTAQAFTLSEDQSVQLDVFQLLKKRGKHAMSEHHVRAELADKRAPAKDCIELRFVGEDVYLAAGGKLAESLFDDDRYVDDMPLLKKLARQKLDAEAKRLKADGWKFAEGRLEDGEGDFQTWDCENVKGDDESENPDDYTPAERKKSGVIVEISTDGDGFDYFPGLIKPTRRKASSQDAGDDFDTDSSSNEDPEEDGDHDFGADIADEETSQEASGPYAVSQALTQRVTEALTIAASKTLAQDPMLAMRVITAALTASYISPAHVSNQGHSAVRGDSYIRDNSFAQVFARVAKLDADKLDAAFAAAVASTLDLTHATWRFKGRDSGAADMVAAMIGGEFTAHARDAFNAPDYFAGAKKDAAVEAIEEMRDAIPSLVLAPRKTHEAMKKGELADLATRMAKQHGWLPPELRHPGYELADAKPASKKRKAA